MNSHKTTTAHPVLFDLSADLAPTASDAGDSWWFASRLRDDDGDLYWTKTHVIQMSESYVSTVSVLRDSDRRADERHTAEPAAEVKAAADRLDVQTSLLDMSGGPDEFTTSGATDDAAFRLTLRRTEPALYNGGSGVFPFLGGRTGQLSLPGLAATGTITIDGVERNVKGRTWFDRQWIAGPADPPRFLWFGLDLGDGRYLSVWDTTGDGVSWLTALKPDGTHVITGAQRTAHEGGYLLAIPDLDASLEITYRRLDATEGDSTNVCTVAGTFAGREVTGHGYHDIVGASGPETTRHHA